MNRPPYQDLDYIILTAADVADNPTGMLFLGLSAVFAAAGLENTAVALMWYAYPLAHDSYPFRVLLNSARIAARQVQEGAQEPVYAPPEIYAAEPGLYLSAYDLYYHATEDLFHTVADSLTAGGRPDLARIVLDEMPNAVAKARGRLAPYAIAYPTPAKAA